VPLKYWELIHQSAQHNIPAGLIIQNTADLLETSASSYFVATTGFPLTLPEIVR
jgi:hypothetical protein